MVMMQMPRTSCAQIRYTSNVVDRDSQGGRAVQQEPFVQETSGGSNAAQPEKLQADRIKTEKHQTERCSSLVTTQSGRWYKSKWSTICSGRRPNCFVTWTCSLT